MEPTSPQFPISHVKVRPQSAWSDEVRHMKLDAFGQTDEMRQAKAEGAKINGEGY